MKAPSNFFLLFVTFVAFESYVDMLISERLTETSQHASSIEALAKGYQRDVDYLRNHVKEQEEINSGHNAMIVQLQNIVMGQEAELRKLRPVQ
jgi:hypothetical protein